MGVRKRSIKPRVRRCTPDMEDAATVEKGTDTSKAQVGGSLNLPVPLLGVFGPLFPPGGRGLVGHPFLKCTLGWSTGGDCGPPQQRKKALCSTCIASLVKEESTSVFDDLFALVKKELYAMIQSFRDSLVNPTAGQPATYKSFQVSLSVPDNHTEGPSTRKPPTPSNNDLRRGMMRGVRVNFNCPFKKLVGFLEPYMLPFA